MNQDKGSIPELPGVALQAAPSSTGRTTELGIDRDGPHEITDARRWLARQLLDSKLSDAEAYGILAYHPGVTAALSPLPPPKTPK